MKKILTLLLATLCVQAAFAQYRPEIQDNKDLSYKQLKSIYNYKDYEKTFADKYSAGWSGVASFAVPGLGQMMCGEFGRGFTYLGAHVAGVVLTRSLITTSAIINEGEASDGAAIAALATFTGVLAIDICSIVDAVRVAKVKNMYIQDLRKNYAVDMKVAPSFNVVYDGYGSKPTAGVSLAINF